MGSTLSKPSHLDRDVHAGFIPLADCAPLVMAHELGFDRDEGFTLHLHREVSWANIRDKVDAGLFDCAHMLAPLPIAATLGIARATEPVIAPLALGLNGNTITVSNAVFSEMSETNSVAARSGGMTAAAPLAAVIAKRAKAGLQPLTLGMVFPFSCHNYDLRIWLASAGVDPNNDVNLVVIPPPLIADSLRTGRVDGFCAGEPWGSVVAEEGAGVVVATKNQLWRNSPEKVLGVRLAWADRNADVLKALIRAVVRAAIWLDQPENRTKAAVVLAEQRYVGAPVETLQRVLALADPDGNPARVPRASDTIVFHRYHATFPWQSHAMWIMTQMIRWGQIHRPFNLHSSAGEIYRTDIYRNALAGTELAAGLPSSDLKSEGPDGFFDGQVFEPTDPIGYLKSSAGRASAIDLKNFAAFQS